MTSSGATRGDQCSRRELRTQFQSLRSKQVTIQAGDTTRRAGADVARAGGTSRGRGKTRRRPPRKESPSHGRTKAQEPEAGANRR